MRPVWRLLRSGAVVLTALVLVGACTGKRATPDDKPSPSSSPSLSPSATLTAEQQASSEALAVYKAFWAANSAAAQAGLSDSPDMRKYATDPLLTRMIQALATLAARNILQTGETVFAPKVTKVDLAASPAVVTIEDCVDERGLRAVSRTDRSPIPLGPKKPYFMMATVIRSADGRWLLNNATPQADRPC